MIVLGIESATESVGAAITDGEESSATIRSTGGRRHAENLAPSISAVLERAGVGLGRLDAIALDVGPGLFTGLRVGVAMAKGLAQGLGIGVLGVTSLEILAWAALDGGWTGSVVPVVDGRRGEVFAARYARGVEPGHLLELAPPSRHRPEQVAAELMVSGDGPVLACGDGALRYRDVLVAGGIAVAGPVLGAPDPLALVSLAVARIESGAALSSATDVRPVYLREADARINWMQRAPVPTVGG